MPADRFNYNEAISRSEKEQMLLNLVRMRYRDIPVFLAVSSVLTQYSYSGGAGVSGFAALDASTVASSTVGGSANLGYTERPTITYTPLSGSEFSRRMLSPIAAELMFAAAQAGWPTELLFLIALQRVNDVENMSFLARGTEAPALHLEEDRVVDMGSWGDLVPFRILSSPTPPKDAFSAVWYQGHWFYIAHSDHESKRVLGLLIYIFRLQAPATVAATPILTLPTGP